MKIRQLLPLVVTAGAMAGWSAGALAEAAKAKFEAVCSECHEVADFEGVSESEISENLTAFVAKTKKHKKALTLTPAEITDMAKWLAGGGK